MTKSSSVISVENLGKKYLLQHQQRENYTALRDVISNGLTSLGTRLIHPFRRLASASSPLIKHSDEDFWALRNVSFEVKQGDRIGIIGRNGAGKSTLLKILSRITEPTTGSIRIKGRVASLLEVGTGFHPELTGRENIFLNGAILGMQREEIRRKFDEIVDFAEIEKFLDTPVKRYSSGMYVRLAFAVAAHLEPEILIVDEVLAVGDVQFQKKCLGKMEKVGSEGRTILFVSHNLQAVTTLCNSSIWIDKGTICGCGNTNEIIKKYLTVSGPKKSSWFRQLTDVSKKASVKSIIVTNHEGQPAHDLSYEHPFSIDITYDFNVPISGVAAAIRLKTSDNVCVLVTSEKDSPNVDTMTQRDGQYHSRCYFPGKLFKPGTYIINVGLFREGVEVYDFHEDIVSFEINPEGCVFFDTRDGILMTPLNWQILDSFDV